MEILLHTERLPKQTADALLKGGVVALRVKDLNAFRFVSPEVRSITLDNMLWAAFDALAAQSSFNSESAVRLVQNLKTLAEEQRARDKNVEGTK